MAIIPSEVKTAIEKTCPTCIATADKNGTPNIVYITYLKIEDNETIAIADNKFEKTRKNLDENPVLAFTVIDTDTKKAYQIKGKVQCFETGEKYDKVVEWVHTNHPQMTPKAAFYLNVDEIYCGAEKLV